MAKLNLETCNCILQESENRKLYELAYMLGRMTKDDIVQALVDEGINTHSVIVENHMRRHIPMDVQEEVTEYLPSVASTCAQMLARVKTRATMFLDKTTLAKDEIRLLGILVSETNKYLDKLGSITGEAQSVNTPVAMMVPDTFGKVCMDVLPEFPDAWKAVRDKMSELDKE